MPFQSQAQWRWAFATHQEFADAWAKMTPGGKRRFQLLAKRKRTTTKHLPGKHNQADHGHRGNDGASGGGAVLGTIDHTLQTIKDADHALQSEVARISNADVQYPNHIDPESWDARSFKYDQIEKPVRAAIQDRYDAVAVSVSHLSAHDQAKLLASHGTDGGVVYSIANYGATPELRMQAGKELRKLDEQQIDIGKHGSITVPHNEMYNHWKENSLDYIASIGHVDIGHYVIEQHVAGNIRGLLGAHTQTALSYIGPNASVPREDIPSFYKPGIKPPPPNPSVVAALNDTYQHTQKMLSEDGITERELFRGGTIAPGIAMEPWSTSQQTANRFAQPQGSILRQRTIPAQYIFAASDTTYGFGSQAHETENMVFGAAVKRDFGLHDRIPIKRTRYTGSGYLRSSVDEFEQPTEYTKKMWGEEIDNAPQNGFDYERPYDIYYNYRTATARIKMFTTKHLPGKHNQTSHGHKGPAGSASRAAYTAARAEGASHREALDKGKLASQQVREQMRTERRAQVEARRAERAANPKPKRTELNLPEYPHETHAKLIASRGELQDKLSDIRRQIGETNLSKEEYEKLIQKSDLIKGELGKISDELFLNQQKWQERYAAAESARVTPTTPPRAETPTTPTTPTTPATPTTSRTAESDSIAIALGNRLNNARESELLARRRLDKANAENASGLEKQSAQREYDAASGRVRQLEDMVKRATTPTAPTAPRTRQSELQQTMADSVIERRANNTRLEQIQQEMAKYTTPDSPYSSDDPRYEQLRAERATLRARNSSLEAEYDKGLAKIREIDTAQSASLGSPEHQQLQQRVQEAQDRVTTGRSNVGRKLSKAEIAESKDLLQKRQSKLDEFERRAGKQPEVAASVTPPRAETPTTPTPFSSITRTTGTTSDLTRQRDMARQRESNARARLAKIKLSHGKGLASDNSLLLAKQDYEREQTLRKKLDADIKQLTATKADDSVGGIPRRYSAHAGEVITGALGRDTSGKFTRVGSNEGQIVRAAINRGIASAGGGKGKRGAKRAAVSDAQKRQHMADTGAELMDKLGFDASDWDFIAGDKPQDASDPQFTRLIELGLMDNVDGMAYPSALGRKVAAATGAGNEDKARELIARDAAKRKQRQAKMDAQISAYEDVINDKTASPRARKIAARKRTLLIGRSDTTTKASDAYTPPAGVQAQAKRGLALRSEFGRGGTSVGIARARDLSNGKSVSRDTIMRMVSFFARHAVDKRPDWSNPSNPSNGYIAHLLWGGDAGKSWANKIANQISSTKSQEGTMFDMLTARLKHLPGKHNQASHGHKGPAGSASRAAYTAARAEGASHREALDKGKLASQQVREQMRTERRAQVEARRAERAANLKPKQATSPRTETPIDTRPLISVDTAQKHNNRIMSLKNNLALAEKDKAFALAQLPKIEAQYAGDTSDLAVYKLKQARLNVASAQERIDRANQGIARFSQNPPEGRAYTTANNPEIKAYAEQMGIPDHEGFVFTDQWKGEIKSLAAQGFRKPKETPKAETPQTMRARQLVGEGHRMWEGGDKQRVYINDPRIRNFNRGGIYYDVKTGTWHQQEPEYSGSGAQRKRQQEEWNAIASEYQQKYMK